MERFSTQPSNPCAKAAIRFALKAKYIGPETKKPRHLEKYEGRGFIQHLPEVIGDAFNLIGSY